MLNKYFDKYVAIQIALFVVILLSSPYMRVHLHIIGLVVGLLLLCLGTWFVFSAAQLLGTALTPAVTPVDNGKLVTTGVYNFVRHPLYYGVMLMTVGWSILWGSILALVFSIGLAVFFAYKVDIEEALLSAKYPDYADYKARVKNKLIPFLY